MNTSKSLDNSSIKNLIQCYLLLFTHKYLILLIYKFNFFYEKLTKLKKKINF